MASTIGSVDATRGKSGRDERTLKARSPRDDHDANPRSRRVNRSLRASAAFAAFSAEVRDDLNPRGPLQRLMADHVAQTAWRLKATLDRHADRDEVAAGEPAPKRPAPTAADRAARSVREAVESYDYLRGRPAPPVVTANPPVEIEPNEWPIVPDDETYPIVDEVEAADFAEGWRDRLVFDFEISDNSPIVKGTWVTVGHVVSEIVDGSTWADILRTHPELTEEDIRACLAYAIAEEN